MTSDFLNLVSTVLFFVVGFAILRWVKRFEPQWVSRDGTRFSARMTQDSIDATKWVDVRVCVDGRQLFIQARGRRGKAFQGRWNVGYFTQTTDLKRRHYMLTNVVDIDDRAILRVPATSTCIAALDALSQ